MTPVSDTRLSWIYLDPLEPTGLVCHTCGEYIQHTEVLTVSPWGVTVQETETCGFCFWVMPQPGEEAHHSYLRYMPYATAGECPECEDQPPRPWTLWRGTVLVVTPAGVSEACVVDFCLRCRWSRHVPDIVL